MSRPASKRAARPRRGTPIAANWSAPPPIAVCMMKRPLAMDARVPICSASSTGDQSGNRNSAPAGRSPHSASRRPTIGTFW